MLIPVLLSGGVGSRLWPVSRAGRPKQFLPLGGEGSMLQETQRRLEGLECGPAIVVCNAEHRFMVAEQLRGEPAESPTIILEPAGRATPRPPSRWRHCRRNHGTPRHYCWYCPLIIT